MIKNLYGLQVSIKFHNVYRFTYNLLTTKYYYTTKKKQKQKNKINAKVLVVILKNTLFQSCYNWS